MRGAAVRMLVVAALCTAAAVACSPEQAGPERPPPHEPREAHTAGVPFDLTIEHITVLGMDNAAILGHAGTPPSDPAAVQAVAATRDVLAAFLTTQLIDDSTWFSAGPIDRLLSARARAGLGEQDRIGLGQVTLPVERTVTGPASAVAQVLLHGEEVTAVTLSYTALLTVILQDGGASAASQAGSMTFVPTEEGWRADAVEVVTELPGATP